MNHNLKVFIWTISILLIIGFFGWKIFVNIFSMSFSRKCEVTNTWEIENYNIEEKRCIGFAGPPFYPIYLYKKGIEIDYINHKSDSCIVQFTNEKGYTLEFDLCSEKLK